MRKYIEKVVKSYKYLNILWGGISMKVIVISESLIIRKGIVEILSKENYEDTIKESHR